MFKKNLTRKTLSNNIHQNLGFSKNFSLSIIDDFFETLASELIKFKKVKISSFGTFKVANKKKRIGRNPKTKEKKIISARNVVTFKASKFFKDKINQKN